MHTQAPHKCFYLFITFTHFQFRLGLLFPRIVAGALCLNGGSLMTKNVGHGVPKGSVLGPI